MEAEYRISEDDYVGAMRLHYRLTLRWMLVYIVAFLLLAIAAVAGTPVIRGGALGGIIGALIVIVLGRLVFSPMMARRHYRKYKAIQEPIRIGLQDEGATFSTADASGIVPWDKVYRWRQNDEFLLIYPMPRLYHIVPKAVAASGFDVNVLAEKLAETVGPES